MQAYMRLMNRRPLLGPCITTAFLFGTGDIVAQQAVDKRGIKEHDWVRTARLSLYGGTIFAPIVVNWYKLLDRMPIKSKPALVATRVGLDQFAFAPVAVGLFFSCTGLMEGKSLEQVKQKLNSSYKDTLIANWMLFIPFQTINMAFIPLHHRLLAVNAVSIPWNAFLSWKGASVSKTVVA
ncbi:unnamed protein product [Rhizoctonia solani]|uniref:Protein SYM1 n=1 Tax=Rhizoctonia solani TaxID=456999 RepID=A0A8H3A2K1_9AGAM|nr:unnamed protein product [Rhizoctonia solani]